MKKWIETRQGQEGVVAFIESAIEKPTSHGGSPSLVRRFYTDNYPALDRFDRLWYEMKFLPHSRDWESYFTWSLLYATVVNARSVWCAATGERVSMKEFLETLVKDYVKSLQ